MQPPAFDLSLRLALHRAPLLGPVSLRQLLEHCGAPEIWRNCTDPQLSRGLKSAQWRVLADLLAGDVERYAGVASDREWLEQPENAVVHLDQQQYPVLLRQIQDAPFLLFVRGQSAALHVPQLAVVGSRHPTRTGLKDCSDFSTHLVRQGFAITSGLALGIDGAAHQAALEAGGITLAVMAHGLQHIYPGRHRSLAAQITERGALVSEFPLGVAPKPEFFPRRNRIISGLSLGVLVVEAALQSGSLITAREALDQGREVFAIPGSIHSPLSRGCHRLIRQGAKLVETGNDIVEDLGPLLCSVFQGFTDNPAPAIQALPAVSEGLSSGIESRLLSALVNEPLSVNDLVEITGASAAEINAALMLLELQGHVLQMRGQFVRI